MAGYIKYRDWLGASRVSCVHHPITHCEPIPCGDSRHCTDCCLNRNIAEIPNKELDSLFIKIDALKAN